MVQGGARCAPFFCRPNFAFYGRRLCYYNSMENNGTLDLQARRNPSEIWSHIKNDIDARFAKHPDAVDEVSKMSEEDFKAFQNDLFAKYMDNPKYSVVVGEIPEKRVRWDSFTSSYVDDTPAPKTRKLQSPDIERIWRAYGEYDKDADKRDAEAAKYAVPLDRLDGGQRAKLAEIAEAEDSPLLPYLKFDKRYLEDYAAARDYFVKEARRMQADGGDWRNTWLGEAARGFGGMIINPANAVANVYRRWRGGVPHGNPDGLSDAEIRERAVDDAFGEMYGYMTGTKDFEDMRENAPLGRKISRGVGELLGFIFPTAEGKLFEGGVKAATALGAKKTIGGAAAKFAAGGVVVSPTHLDVGSPVNPRNDVAGQLAANAVAEGASSAVFGAGLSAVGRGLSAAAHSPLNPLYKTGGMIDSKAAGEYISNLWKRIENDAPVSPKERAFFDFVMDEAAAQKISVGDVLSGRVAPKFVERQLRPWVGEIPILRGLMRDKNSYWKFEKTGIDNADVRGEKFDADAFRRGAEDAVSAATPPARGGLRLGYESPEMLARRVAGQPKFDLDAPFYIDEAQKRFSSADEFSDWVLAVDSGAAESFERFRNLPDAKKQWQAEYLPAYARKYGARVGGVNAVVRSGDALDAARTRKMIDSIPDEEESLKLEAIGDADIEQLSDAHLEYAAERGQTWAADELVRRAEAENAAGIDSDDVFARLDFEGAKLPTPEAMARKGGSLSEEMKAVYDSLPAALKRKYFADRNVKLDELAESLGYETEAELISALSDAAGRVADGYKVGNEKRRTKNEERRVGTPAKKWKSEPLDGVPESVATEIRRAENGLFDALTHKRDLKDFIYRDGLGYVSCYYGEDGKIKDGKYTGGSGIAHLIGRRNNEGLDGFGIAMKIPRIVKLGKIGDEYGPENGKRVNIVYGDHTVVLSKFRFGEKENWVVTAWKNNDAGDAVNASSGYAVRNHGISTEQVASISSQSETVSESQGKNLRSYEKRDFEDVDADGFVPAAQASIEKSMSDDAANAAKWVAMTPEERIAEACPDYVDKAIQLSRAMARKNGGRPLPTYGGLKLELMALKSGKFKIVEDGKKLKPIKVFRDEAQAREFLGKWILAYADAGKITYYAPADVRGVFADAGGLSAENAYVRDAKGEIKVDGVVMRRAKPERLVRDVFVANWDKEYDSVRGEKAELEKLNRRDFESVDEFKRWLEKNSAEVEKKFGSIRMEYRFDKENLGKPAAEEETEIARRQQFWLDNNIEDLARLYKARIKEEEFDFEDEVDVGDGLDWEDGGDGGFGAPANAGGRERTEGKLTLKLKARIAEFVDELKGRILNEEQGGIASVVSGGKNYYHIRIDDLGNVIAFLRGSRDKSGANHIMLKHYGENARMGYVSADEILQIGEIIRSGNLEIVNENERRYWVADPNYEGRKLTVVVKKSFKKKQPDFVLTFYSNKKAEEVRAKKQASGATHSVLSSSTIRTQSENASESQGKKLSDNENTSFGSSGGGRMESSTNPYPPDLTMPKDDRFDPKRVDSSARKDYDAGAAQAAFDGVWDTLGNVKRGYSSAQIREVEAKMRDFTKKMDARMLELPELIEFAERIISGKVRAVKGFKGDYLGMYYGGEKKIELRRDLFKLVGDCRRYEVALDAAREVLKKKGFNEEVVESRRPDQIVQAVYENNLMPAYHAAFQKKINVEFGKAKRGGEPSAALMVAAHEIMHAVDDVRADGSKLGKHSGGTLGAIVGEIPKCITAVSKIRGWGEVLTPEVRKSISKCADFAAGRRPKNPEKLKEWRKYRNDYRQKEIERFCAENRILTREVAVKELNEVIAWWQGLPSVDMVGKYFQQPWERYAEAGAAFLCNTKMFAKLAPNVYEAMLGNMRARPKFWQNWQEFQRRLDNPQGNARRTAETVKRGFAEARLADAEYAKSVRKADLAYLKEDLKTYYRTENAPLYDLAEKLAKRNGGRAYDAYGLIADFHDYRYAATFQEAYMARVARVYEKLAQNKIDLDDFDAALLCLRIDQGRADIANPYGITPKRARAVFAEIMGGYCEPARLAFREAIRMRSALRREFVVRPLVELRAFDEKTNGILLGNNSYAKIERSKAGEPAKSDLELLMKGLYGDSCGGLIMRQFGTLAAVKSPSAATLEKDLKAIAFVKSQKASRAVADVCLEMNVGREADTEAVYNRDGTFRANVPKIVDNDRVKTLVILENSAARGVYVPAYLANAIMRSGGGSMARVLEGLNDVNYAVKSVLVQYNFMAWPVLHVRDVLHELRAVSMLGGGLADSLAQCLKLAAKFPAAYRSAFSGWRGRPDETYLDALDRGMVVGRRNRYTGDAPDLHSGQQQLVDWGIRDEKLLGARLGLLRRLFYAYDSMGQVFERSSKIAMKLYLDERGGFSEAEERRFVREQGGSPDFNERINRTFATLLEWVHNVLFVNPMIQGFRSEVALAQAAKAVAENRAKLEAEAAGGRLSDAQVRAIGLKAYAKYLAYLAAFSSGGALLYACARLGLGGVFAPDGDEDAALRRWRKIPEWDRRNRICVPFAEDVNGKSVYLKLPYGDFERYMGNFLTAAVEAMGERESFGESCAEIFNTAREIPVSEFGGGSHPIASSLYALGDYYLRGNNPRDWRGAEILDPVEYKAGDALANAQSMGRYVYNQTVGGVVGRIPKTPRDGTPPPSTAEMWLSMPFIRPLVGRYIGVSDAGVQEVARRAQDGVAAAEAQRTLLRRGIVADAVQRGGDGRYEYAAERVAELPDANRQDYGYVRSRLRRADRRSSTAEAAVDDAPTRRQKEAVRAELERLRLIDSRGE